LHKTGWTDLAQSRVSPPIPGLDMSHFVDWLDIDGRPAKAGSSPAQAWPRGPHTQIYMSS